MQVSKMSSLNPVPRVQLDTGGVTSAAEEKVPSLPGKSAKGVKSGCVLLTWEMFVSSVCDGENVSFTRYELLAIPHVLFMYVMSQICILFLGYHY